MKRSLFLLLTILTLLFLSSCGGPGGTDPIDPTDPTTSTDPTDPTTTTTDPTFPFPVDPVDPTTTTDPTSPTTVDMTGTWTGTTTSSAYGSEETTLTLTQSGSSLSGTLSVVTPDETLDADATGSISGSTATVSASYTLRDDTGATVGEVEYQFSGTVSGTTYAGTLTLNFSDGEQGSGTFNLTQGGSTTDPSDPTVTTDPTEPSSGVSGTVTAGVDVTGTVVAACLESDECATPVFASPLPLDSTGAYSITGLQATPYIVLAIKDVDNNGLTAGDYVGIYEAPVSPPASGINFTLQPYTGSESPITKQLSERLGNLGKIQQYKRAP